MREIINPSFQLRIQFDDETQRYLISEPTQVPHAIFFLEAARFIRETPNTKSATLRLMTGEEFDFGPCGIRMDEAYTRISEHYIKNRRDWFLTSVANVEIDSDNHLVVTIDPTKTKGDETAIDMDSRNLTAFHVEIITGYTRLHGQHEYFPEFLKILGASKSTIDYATPLNRQREISNLPVRFVTVDGRRITLTRDSNTGFPDIRYG